jgi:hypothetical protein
LNILNFDFFPKNYYFFQKNQNIFIMNI